jgi:hypothetical protein
LSACAPAVLNDEQARALALNARGDQHCSRLGQRLHARSDIGRVAENLAGRIDHDRARFDADPSDEFRSARSPTSALQLGQRALDRESRTNGALGVVLLGDRVTEHCHDPVSEFLGDMPTHLRNGRGRRVEVAADEIAPVLGVERGGEAGRADEIAEQDREMAALGALLPRRFLGLRLRGLRVALDLARASDGAESASIADSILRRCPTTATPSSSRSSAVSSWPSIALSRKATSY